mmetsp:Transcript_28833/g.93223  ORF Transcript_28833/g.93223 Transcript_28833/m.93223 type:complete len:203 (+) Transcript_28833:133-741(+)
MKYHIWNLRCLEWDHVTGTDLLAERLAGLTFSKHVANNTEHGKATVSHLRIQLLRFLFRPVFCTKETNVIVAVILRCRPPRHLNQSCEEQNLRDTGSWNLEDTLAAVRDIRELELLREREVAREFHVGVVRDASYHRHHGNAAMFTFNSTTAFKALWLIGAQPKRVPETCRRLDPDRGFIDCRSIENEAHGRRRWRHEGRGS